jgi:hypothetical protein
MPELIKPALAGFINFQNVLGELISQRLLNSYQRGI